MDDDEAIKRASGKYQAARFELEHVRSGYDKGWRSPAELAAAEEALYMARVDLEKLQALRADREKQEGEARHAAKIEAEFEAREDSELWQMLLDYGVTGEGKTLRAGISEALSILEHRVAHLATALERSGVDPSSVGVCGSCFGRGTQSFGFPCEACGGTGQAAAAVARAR